MKKGRIIIFLVIFAHVVLLGAGCATIETQQVEKMEDTMGSVDWRDVEFRDIKTNQEFKISDFTGKTVLLESFAVWCPTCKRQQDEIKKLHEEIGDSVVSISLDTDPNEDVAKIQEHLNRYGYDWRFVVSPPELTRALIGEFGVSVVNAPGAPVVLVCENQSARLLGRGVKSAEKLREELNKGC